MSTSDARIHRTAMAAVLLAVSVALAAQPSDRERAEALARRAAARLQALHQEAQRLATQEGTLLGDLRKLEVDREIKLEELREAAANQTAAEQDLATTNDQIQRLEREDVADLPELRTRLVELYKLGQGRYLRLLLSMSDVRSVGQASRVVAAVAKRDHDRVAAHESRLAELRKARTSLQARAKDLEAVRQKAERARTDVDRAVNARNQLIQSIDNQRDLNAQLAGELVLAQQKLQTTLRDMAAGTATADAALPLRPFQGDLDWPVTGTVRRRFGRAAAAGLPPMNGVEIAAEDGAPVQAVYDGTVAFVGPFAGFGNIVIVQHDAQSYSVYGNLADITVARGARIDRGQLVGSVGASSTGPPGLYFELRVDGRAVDPLQWLKKR